MQKADVDPVPGSASLERQANTDALLRIFAHVRESHRISLDALRNALEHVILAVIRGRTHLEQAGNPKNKKNSAKRRNSQLNKKRRLHNAEVLTGIDTVSIVITENEIKRKQKIISVPLKETLCKYDLGLLLCMKIKSRPRTALEKHDQSRGPLEYNELAGLMVKNTARIYKKKGAARFYPLWATASTRFLRCFLSRKRLLPLLKKEIAPKVTVTKSDQVRDSALHASDGLVWVTVDGTPLIRFTKNVTPYDIICLDCEMVRTKKGLEVGHVAIIDKKGNTVYNKIVVPKHPVIDYLTEYSGLSPSSFGKTCGCPGCAVTDTAENLTGIKNLETNQITPCKKQIITQEKMRSELAGIIGANTIIIGHSLTNDLYALGIYHKKLVDTSFLFHGNNGIYKMKLRDIAKKYLGKEIQEQQHSPVEDAVATLDALVFAIKHREKTKTVAYQQLHKNFRPLVHFPDMHPSRIRKNRLNLIFSTDTPSIIKRSLYINCFNEGNEWRVSVFCT